MHNIPIFKHKGHMFVITLYPISVHNGPIFVHNSAWCIFITGVLCWCIMALYSCVMVHFSSQVALYSCIMALYSSVTVRFSSPTTLYSCITVRCPLGFLATGISMRSFLGISGDWRVCDQELALVSKLIHAEVFNRLLRNIGYHLICLT